MATASLSYSLAASHSGRIHGSEQQHMPDGVRGGRRIRGIGTVNCHAWGIHRVTNVGNCKLDLKFGLNAKRCHGGVDFIRSVPAQSRVWRITAISRLDDEFREGSDGDDVGETSSLQDDDVAKEVQVDLQLPRRRLLVEFTCNVCQTRTQRLVNPEAYKRGTVYVQCGGCEAYHQLVDNLGLVVEYDFREENDSNTS